MASLATRLSDLVAAIGADIKNLRTLGLTKGTWAARPAASSVRPGATYFSTDIGALSLSDGSTWGSAPIAFFPVRCSGITPFQAVPRVFDGQLVDFVVDTTTIWSLRYNSVSGNWDCIGGNELLASDTASSTLTNTAYAAHGPTLTLPIPGDYDVRAEAETKAPASQAQYMGPSISVAGIADTTARKTENSTFTSPASMTRRLTGVTVGQTLGVYDRVTGGTTGTIAKRVLTAIPVSVSNG